MTNELSYFGSDGTPLFALVLTCKLETPKSTIIFLHGGGPDHKSMLPLGEKFTDAYSVVLPDIRGYGRSVCRDRNRYTWKQYSDDLMMLITLVNAPSIVVVAAGIGTTISLKTILKYPHSIQSLVLISIEDMEDDVQKELEIKLLESFASRVESDGIEAAWKPLLDSLSPVIGHMVRDAIHRSDAQSIAAAAIVYDRSFQNIQELKDIAIPVLVIPGSDYRHPRALSESISKLLVKGHLASVSLSDSIRTIQDFSNMLFSPIKDFVDQQEI